MYFRPRARARGDPADRARTSRSGTRQRGRKQEQNSSRVMRSPMYSSAVARMAKPERATSRVLSGGIRDAKQIRDAMQDGVDDGGAGTVREHASGDHALRTGRWRARDALARG